MKTLLFQFCLTSKHEVVCATQLRAFFVSNFLVISGRDVFNFNQHPSSWIRKKENTMKLKQRPHEKSVWVENLVYSSGLSLLRVLNPLIAADSLEC